MKIRSYTLAEAMIVIFVIGIIASSMAIFLKPGSYEAQAYKKLGMSEALKIGVATKQILAKYSFEYKMTSLKTVSGTRFSITDTNADANLAALYKKILGSATYTAPSNYTEIEMEDESGTKVGLKISNFTQGFKTKHSVYVAFKLNGNCTTTESHIYDPSAIDNRNATRSCGLLLFDVNNEKGPNIAGVDIYIVSIGTLGIK